MRELRIKIFGDVIGVGFRYQTKQKADELELVGWVKNLPDGSVELLAQGEKADLEKLMAWAKTSPPNAKVAKLETQWQEPERTFESFEIRY